MKTNTEKSIEFLNDCQDDYEELQEEGNNKGILEVIRLLQRGEKYKELYEKGESDFNILVKRWDKLYEENKEPKKEIVELLKIIDKKVKEILNMYGGLLNEYEKAIKYINSFDIPYNEERKNNLKQVEILLQRGEKYEAMRGEHREGIDWKDKFYELEEEFEEKEKKLVQQIEYWKLKYTLPVMYQSSYRGKKKIL